MSQTPKFIHRTQLAKLKKKKKITAKVLHITQHYQVHSINISQHYSSTSQQHSTQNSGSITAKSQYQVLHIDPLKHP